MAHLIRACTTLQDLNLAYNMGGRGFDLWGHWLELHNTTLTALNVTSLAFDATGVMYIGGLRDAIRVCQALV